MKREHMQNKKVVILGLGYIGLPTAALLANRGYQVQGVDIQKTVVETINAGKIHIVEPDLDTFVRAAVESGNLKASLSPSEADVFIIAVPTPFSENYTPNIDFVLAATRSIVPVIKSGDIIILESTSPVGTTEKIWNIIKESGKEMENIFVAHCPERVLPGYIMKELIENDRIIGGINSNSSEKTREFYATFVQGNLLITDARTAEMAKLTENSFRDVNIAFANELSMICADLNINVSELISLANHHPRVNILKPGPGVGGHCIAVDPWFIVHSSPQHSALIKKSREVNLTKTKWVIKKIHEEVSEFKKTEGRDPVVAIWGITYKPDIDDMRESPSLEIAEELHHNGLNLVVVEPNCTEAGDLNLMNIQDAIKKADISVFLVAHRQFKNIILDEKRRILDFCGIRG